VPSTEVPASRIGDGREGILGEKMIGGKLASK
jgi:hypothetical protein